jgi:hypothetical protein
LVAHNFVKLRRLCPTLIAKISSLVGVVDNVEVIVINIFSGQDVGDKFQDRRLSDPSLANKKDRVWRLRLVLRRLDNALFKRLYIAELLLNLIRQKCGRIHLIVGVSPELGADRPGLVESLIG